MSRKRASRVRLDPAFAAADSPEDAAGRLFAVACPGCRAELAVTTDMAGGEARCPTCAAPFTVPEPRMAEPLVPRAVPPAQTPAQTPAAPPPAEPATASTAEPAPGPLAGEPPATIAPAAESSAAPPAGSALVPAAPADVGPDVVSVGDPAATADGGSAPAAAADAPRGELEFREPVRSITVGDSTIELRRLSPEEKRVRRARRNILILIVGAAMLVALVLALGRR